MITTQFKMIEENGEEINTDYLLDLGLKFRIFHELHSLLQLLHLFRILLHLFNHDLGLCRENGQRNLIDTSEFIFAWSSIFIVTSASTIIVTTALYINTVGVKFPSSRSSSRRKQLAHFRLPVFIFTSCSCAAVTIFVFGLARFSVFSCLHACRQHHPCLPAMSFMASQLEKGDRGTDPGISSIQSRIRQPLLHGITHALLCSYF